MLRTIFHEQLETTRADTQRLFAVVVDAVKMAVRSLKRHDDALAGRVIAGYDGIEDLRRSIERTCIQLLWKQTPLAGELRLVTGLLEITTDLERIAHYAGEIAKQSVKVNESTPSFEPPVVFGMADIVQPMLDDAFASFKESSTERAQAAIAPIDSIDALYTEGITALQAAIRSDPGLVDAGTALLFVISALQRVAEQVENIGYHELYILEAQPADKP